MKFQCMAYKNMIVNKEHFVNGFLETENSKTIEILKSLDFVKLLESVKKDKIDKIEEKEESPKRGRPKKCM